MQTKKKEKKNTSWLGPSDILVGSPLSKKCSHAFIDWWSSLRCPHFGFLGNPISDIVNHSMYDMTIEFHLANFDIMI